MSKKSNRTGLSLIALIFVFVVIVAIIGIAVFMLTNTEKVAITPEFFRSTMQSKGYLVGDATQQFASYDYIEQVYVARDNTSGYQIEFYELSDDTYALNFFNNNKSIFENSKSGSSTTTNVNLKNYSKYSQSSNGQYMVVARIDNTVIYVNVDSTYKDVVKNILDELGY